MSTRTESREITYDVVVLGTMASPMGMTYGGHGGTLGPAITVGRLAGGDAAERAGRA